MAAKTGITPPIYKIDADAANEFFGGALSAKDLPAKLIDRYNKDKGIETYAIEGTSEIDGCSLQLYRNVKTRPSTSSWVKFSTDRALNSKRSRTKCSTWFAS